MSDHFLDICALVKHFAVASELPRKGVPAESVTADHVLLAVAPLEGLTVNNPEVP